MGIIELEKVEDNEIREKYYNITINYEEFETFKKIFQELAGISPTLVGYDVFKEKGSTDPRSIVFRRKKEGIIYELKGEFNNSDDTVGVDLEISVREED